MVQAFVVPQVQKKENQLKKKPLLRSCTLPDGEVRKLLYLFNTHATAEDEFMRYMDLKEELRQHNASVRLVETPHRSKIEARLALPTLNATIADRIFNLVTGLGFDLRLRTVPVNGKEERTYIVTEPENYKLNNVVNMARNLLKLAKILQKPEYQELLNNPQTPLHGLPEKRQTEGNVVPLRKAS